MSIPTSHYLLREICQFDTPYRGLHKSHLQSTKTYQHHTTDSRSMQNCDLSRDIFPPCSSDRCLRRWPQWSRSICPCRTAHSPILHQSPGWPRTFQPGSSRTSPLPLPPQSLKTCPPHTRHSRAPVEAADRSHIFTPSSHKPCITFPSTHKHTTTNTHTNTKTHKHTQRNTHKHKQTHTHTHVHTQDMQGVEAAEKALRKLRRHVVESQCVAVCCSVLQCVAVCCSVL